MHLATEKIRSSSDWNLLGLNSLSWCGTILFASTGRNVMVQTNEITLELNVFNECGDVVGTAPMQLTIDQICDIVDHATQATVIRRSGGEYEGVLDELEETLVVPGVLPTDGPLPMIPTDFPTFAQPWAEKRLTQHIARTGNLPSNDEVRSLSDWLSSLPTDRPKMVDKLHKLTWAQAMDAQTLWHEEMARRAEKRTSFGGAPDDVETVLDLGDGWRWVRVLTPEGLDFEGEGHGSLRRRRLVRRRYGLQPARTRRNAALHGPIRP